MTEDEYLYIRSLLGEEKADACRPLKMPNGWYKFQEPCPCFDPDTGCIIADVSKRPLICRLYPFVPVPARGGYLLLLAVHLCPYWMVFGPKYEEAETLFRSFLDQKEIKAILQP
jgi:Fe-S-cluster containining protein